MVNFKIFISVLILFCVKCSYGKICNDCVNFQSCPRAVELAINRDKDTKFSSSYCGFDYFKSQRMVKVCCSDFTDPIGPQQTINRVGELTIETHPNVNLLPESCGDIDGKKITGGKIAKLYEFPWMALISYRTGIGKQFLCAGTIINSKYILTAAHCVLNGYRILGVRVGEYDLDSKTDCQGEESFLVCKGDVQDMRVENSISHPNYSRTLVPTNDIALIRLLKPINFKNKNALPICLPVTQELRDTPLAGTSSIVAGWGLTEDDSYPTVLLKTNISIKTDNECKSFIYDSDSAGGSDKVLNEICAGENQRDSCKGDSGGPLMVQGVFKGVDRYIQYGIVSRGSQQCGSKPGIYTDVSKYMGWILDNMEE